MSAVKIALLVTLIAFAASCRCLSRDPLAPREYAAGTFVSNEAFIDALNVPVHIEEPLSLFRHVFRMLDTRVNVYPSENHYYFLCAIHGVALQGSISLLADRRDEGFLAFSYEEAGTAVHGRSVIGMDIELSERDGVRVTRVSELEYAVEFEDKTVVFVLHNQQDTSIHSHPLQPDEIFVGSSFDESGLKFDLIFNRRCNSFFWLLCENQSVPEDLRPGEGGIVVGRRTAYAFYVDDVYQRKLLLGVSKRNVLQNNWYDGPFDQLPDNEIKRGDVRLQEYIESAYPWTKGRIDRYGIFLSDRDVRVAVVPYLEYSSLNEVRRLVASALTTANPNGLYCALANDILRHTAP